MSLFLKHAELTNEQILDLAQEVTDGAQLRNLAVSLGMSYDMYEKSMVEEQGAREAAYRMLRSWLKSQPDRNIAHMNLFHVLAYANMLEKIHLILPAEQRLYQSRRVAKGTIDHFKAQINSATYQMLINLYDYFYYEQF